MGLRDDVEREWLEREQRIMRYCAGRMSVVESEAFEAEFLDDVELAADVQLAMVLRDGLQEPAPIEPKAASAHPLRSPWLALAAGTLIGAVGLGIVRGTGSDEQVFSDVEYMTLGVVRSAEPQLPSVMTQVGAQSLLVVEVPAEHTTRQIELIHPDGRSELLDGTRDQGYLRIALAPPVEAGAYVAVSGPVRYAFTVEAR